MDLDVMAILSFQLLIRTALLWQSECTTHIYLSTFKGPVKKRLNQHLYPQPECAAICKKDVVTAVWMSRDEPFSPKHAMYLL